MMYKCEWCGAEFDEPFREDAGTFLGNKMVHEVCPWCGADDIVEIETEEEDEEF